MLNISKIATFFNNFETEDRKKLSSIEKIVGE